MLTGCTLPEEKEIRAEMKDVESPIIIETYDTNAALRTPALPLPITPAQREPRGIFRGILFLNEKIEQTVAFNNNNTYRLQEKYLNDDKDSIVTIEGTWAPSDGFIWLYKDQVVRARYKFEDNILKYFNPVSSKTYPMLQIDDIMDNETWKKKEKSGLVFYGIGNEPFWNIAVGNYDSLSFMLADWARPLQLKINYTSNSGDTLAFIGMNDSTKISVTILPYFCSDGMSDYVYRNMVRVKFNNQVYNGCGIIFKP